MNAALKLENEDWGPLASRDIAAGVDFQKNGVFRRHHVLNDPINRVDPSGLLTTDESLGNKSENPNIPGDKCAAAAAAAFATCMGQTSGTETIISMPVRCVLTAGCIAAGPPGCTAAANGVLSGATTGGSAATCLVLSTQVFSACNGGK